MKKYKMTRIYEQTYDNIADARKAFCDDRQGLCHLGGGVEQCPIYEYCDANILERDADILANLMGLEVVNELTEQELAICKAIGAKWASRDDIEPQYASVRLWKQPPMMGSLSKRYSTGIDSDNLAVCAAELFPSLEPGDCVKIAE